LVLRTDSIVSPDSPHAKKQKQKGIDFSLKKKHLNLFTLEKKKREFENIFSS
jgi:transcriptional regulator of met regulon